MRRVLPAFLIALAGCGGSAYAPRTSGAAHEPPGSLDDYEQRIARMQQELGVSLGDIVTEDMVRPSGDSLMEEATAPEGQTSRPVPDCSAAADLRDRICELAERICAIAERDPADRDLKATCESAHAACEQAREDVAASCDDE